VLHFLLMAAQLFVWLVPAAEDAATLQKQIERGASSWDSPPFPPHVTMCSEPAVTKLAAVGSLSELPLSITFTALRFGKDYFHGCYLEAAHDAPLRELQARCVATLGGTVPGKYPPHLSLAYGVLNEAQRGAALRLTQLPQKVTFDRLELWTSDGPVSSWRKLA
jgi:putative hydrolase of the HAD superfamily